MKILITGAAGRVGRAIYARLCSDHEVVGLDRVPSSTSDVVASIEDLDQIQAALQGVDAVIHVAALHAPHVGKCTDEKFVSVNVAATEALARRSAAAGVRSFVFTSTTALYGFASTLPDGPSWIDEDTVPAPRTIYHHTKLLAEERLIRIASETSMPITAIRMSRCFPESAPLMAAYRLHRGVDARDVADAHVLAALAPVAGFRRYVISGHTPFLPEDAHDLRNNAPEVIERRCHELAAIFRRRHWSLPRSIDRVYCSNRAQRELNWRPTFGFEAVLAQLDEGSPEVLPP